MHDSTRELVFMNEKWENEWEMTKNLEILTDKLKKALNDLEIEKKKTDKLITHVCNFKLVSFLYSLSFTVYYILSCLHQLRMKYAIKNQLFRHDMNTYKKIIKILKQTFKN